MNEIIIAIAKGRVFEDVIKLFKESHIDLSFSERELSTHFENLKFYFLKPRDVVLWVENGYADLGVVGLDVVEELESDVYPILDLEIGKCRFSLCGMYGDVPLEKVATKFPNLTKKFLGNVEIINFSGSVEIAPKIGINYITDLVSTGKTLEDNGLKEIRVLKNYSTYLIANRVHFALKFDEIREFIKKIRIVREKYLDILD